jgi:hypothetical protein
MWGSLSSILNTSSIGTVWQPKSNRIQVGRDVGALSATGFCGGPDRNRVLGQGDDVTLKSRWLFDFVKAKTESGGTVPDFRELSKVIKEFGETGFASPSMLKGVDGTVLQQKGDYVVSYNGGGLLVYKKNAEAGEFTQVTAVSGKQDIRIAWDGNGEPQILTGGAALTNGVLAAQGENEFLFRASKADVAAGKGTTVFNASFAEGTYSGGDNVTYLGRYAGGIFTETTGKITFAGYFSGASFEKLTGDSIFSGVFTNASVTLEKGKSTFSGYFSASEIQAGNNGSTVNGLFMDACIVKGGDGDDSFSGRFIDGEVDGGKGDDSFGNTQSMNPEILACQTDNETRVYSGLAADFVNATVNAGEGSDTFEGVMWGGALNLDEGENTVRGMFGEATVNGGKDNDDIHAAYSSMSFFTTGLGDDTVTLVTADQSSVTTDEGTNLVTMGQNNPTPGDHTWQTRDEYFSKSRPMETGELRHNTVNTEKGDNTVGIHNGESIVAVLNGNEYEEKTVGRKADDAGTAEGPSSRGTAEQPSVQNAASPIMPQAPALLDTAGPQAAGDAENGVQTSPSADERTLRYAIGRYLNVYGFEPLAGETPAVTVQTDGESRIFNGVERHNTFEDNEENPGMMRVIRRYNGFGSFSWDRWTRLRA